MLGILRRKPPLVDEHAIPLTGFAVAWLGCTLHLVAAHLISRFRFFLIYFSHSMQKFINNNNFIQLTLINVLNINIKNIIFSNEIFNFYSWKKSVYMYCICPYVEWVFFCPSVSGGFRGVQGVRSTSPTPLEPKYFISWESSVEGICVELGKRIPNFYI